MFLSVHVARPGHLCIYLQRLTMLTRKELNMKCKEKSNVETDIKEVIDAYLSSLC